MVFRSYSARVEIRGILRGEAWGEYTRYEEPYAVGNGHMLLYEPISIDSRVASCTSIYSYVFSLSSPGINGAIPLIEILGAGSFSGFASYRVFNEKLKLIGEVEQTFEGSISDELTKVIGKTYVDAICHDKDLCGDKSIVLYSPGYAVYLTQLDDETIEGVYGQRILTKMGVIYTFTRRVYIKKKLSRSMPFDEVLIYRLVDIKESFGQGWQEISWEMKAYYAPAWRTALNGDYSDESL